MNPPASLSYVIPAVILDWAGTLIDFGSMAPIHALRNTLNDAGISAVDTQLRIGMGRSKRDHLRLILNEKNCAERLDELYPRLEHAMTQCIREHTMLIPGALEFAEALRREDIRIGTTTGYTSAMMREVVESAAQQGFKADHLVCPDHVAAGRPAPLMIFANAVHLRVWPLSSLVKIGDTPADIAEGRNAGTWTVGVALSGNALGLTQNQIGTFSSQARQLLFISARAQLLEARPDYVIDTLADALPVVLEIARRIQIGERPGC